METVLSQPFLFRRLLIDRICFDVVRKGMVEDGVEAGDILDVGYLFETDSENSYRGGIVAVRENFQCIGPKNEQWKPTYSGARSSSCSILW
jgi:hypothetical protein